MWFVNGITPSGYTVKDSANWSHAIQNSQNITVKNITVLGGHDGFDVRTCDNILIEDSIFRTGDDCIAGFDNINVTVRRCILESACSILRFGGRNVLVENCTGGASPAYGFRGSLSAEEKRARADTHEGCRHNCLTVYLSYSDKRAVIREKSGNTLFRNCEFNSPDTIVNVPYGHVWCCNGSLNDILFEDCTFDGIISPTSPNGCPDEPLDIAFKNCTIKAREGSEQISFIEGEQAKSITLDRVSLENFASPEIKCNSGCTISITDSTDVKITYIEKIENKEKYYV
jgi:polygalacturonase